MQDVHPPEMPELKVSTATHKLVVGLSLRCPACEQGRMFTNLLHIEETCPYCDSRFERYPGESTGGMMIALMVAQFVAVGGFFLTEALFQLPHIVALPLWSVLLVIFSLLFYRHARGLWVAVVYLTGAVHPDSDESASGDAAVTVGSDRDERLIG